MKMLEYFRRSYLGGAKKAMSNFYIYLYIGATIIIIFKTRNILFSLKLKSQVH